MKSNSIYNMKLDYEHQNKFWTTVKPALMLDQKSYHRICPQNNPPGSCDLFFFFLFFVLCIRSQHTGDGASCVPPWFFARFLFYLGNIVQSSSSHMPTTPAWTTRKCCAGCTHYSIWSLLATTSISHSLIACWRTLLNDNLAELI